MAVAKAQSTSADLVPTGGAQGDRTAIEGRMRLAGLPSSSESAAPPSAGSGTAGDVAAAGLPPSPAAAPPDLSGYDVFAGREPTGISTASRQVLRSAVNSSQNAVMRDLFARVPGFLEG